MRGLPPLLHILDPRPQPVSDEKPIRESVNIPFDQWRGRTHEFPSAREELLVPELPECEEAYVALQVMGRQAAKVTAFEFGTRAPARLWAPNPWLMSCVVKLEPGLAVDLGCGVGREAVALSALGWNVEGIDRLPDALEKARDLEHKTLGTQNIVWRSEKLVGAPVLVEPNLAFMGYFLDRDLVRSAHEWLAPRGSLVIHIYTDEHYRQHGKPFGAPSVEELLALACRLDLVELDASRHGDRHTASFWFVCGD